MPACPRCQQPVQANDLQCPRCRLKLKAYGHPGIELYRAEEGTYLCSDCVYDADDTCNFPQRPFAQSCTLYQSKAAPVADSVTQPAVFPNRAWLRRNLPWLTLVGLLLISLLIAI
ncbi:MAG: zinc ribbon domain-containing protein [Leptolyngbya sp. SIO4C5]|uniref:zinc ribbon domain-containing protein n=1 Tax=Sphaerothrix gracilis TaxID=3151835 RepID=UPI0013BF2B71|nr:zinc ribbon domain-containing protein [Leptolyngbya sp. SIO4C5]